MTTHQPKEAEVSGTLQQEPSPLISLLSLPLRSYSPLTPRARSVISTTSQQAQDGDAISSGEERALNALENEHPLSAVPDSDSDAMAMEREGPLSATLRQLGVKKSAAPPVRPPSLPTARDRKSITSPGVFAYQQQSPTHVHRNLNPTVKSKRRSVDVSQAPSPRQVGKSHTVVARTRAHNANVPSPLGQGESLPMTRSLSLTRAVPDDGVRSSLLQSSHGRSNSLGQYTPARSGSLRGSTRQRSSSLRHYHTTIVGQPATVRRSSSINNTTAPTSTSAPPQPIAIVPSKETPISLPTASATKPNSFTAPPHPHLSHQPATPHKRGPDGWGGLLPPTGWFPDTEKARGPLVSPSVPPPRRKTKVVRFASVVPSFKDVLGVEEMEEKEDTRRDIEAAPQEAFTRRRVKMTWIYLLLGLICIALALCVGFGVAWHREKGRHADDGDDGTAPVSTRSVNAAPTSDSTVQTSFATAATAIASGHPTAVASAVSLAGRT